MHFFPIKCYCYKCPYRYLFWMLKTDPKARPKELLSSSPDNGGCGIPSPGGGVIARTIVGMERATSSASEIKWNVPIVDFASCKRIVVTKRLHLSSIPDIDTSSVEVKSLYLDCCTAYSWNTARWRLSIHHLIYQSTVMCEPWKCHCLDDKVNIDRRKEKQDQWMLVANWLLAEEVECTYSKRVGLGLIKH